MHFDYIEWEDEGDPLGNVRHMAHNGVTRRSSSRSSRPPAATTWSPATPTPRTGRRPARRAAAGPCGSCSRWMSRTISSTSGRSPATNRRTDDEPSQPGATRPDEPREAGEGRGDDRQAQHARGEGGPPPGGRGDRPRGPRYGRYHDGGRGVPQGQGPRRGRRHGLFARRSRRGPPRDAPVGREVARGAWPASRACDQGLLSRSGAAGPSRTRPSAPWPGSPRRWAAGSGSSSSPARRSRGDAVIGPG